ncbi:hypothetical protein BCT58_00050 [Vibrio lentus]|nr:hypothetical protein BCT58_00050 [Vibrio lentus]
MTKLIHFPYFYRLIITERAEKNLRQRYKENDLRFEYASFIVIINPMLEALGLQTEGDLNPSNNEENANRITALVTEMLWSNMRANNVRYLSPQLD